MSQPSWKVEPITSDADYTTAGDLMFRAFEPPGGMRAAYDHWLERLGRENLRQIAVDGAPGAVLEIFRFAHWFGGRAVPAAGIGGVAVAPHLRAKGLGYALMTQVLVELRREGIPISTLYPSNLPLYRKVGYEQAGARNRFELDLTQLGDVGPPPSARPVRFRPGDSPAPSEEDVAVLSRIHNAFGRTQPGLVSRSVRDWTRILRPGEKPLLAYLIEAEGSPAAYVVYRIEAGSAPQGVVAMMDYAYDGPAGGRALLAFLAGFRSVHRIAMITGGPVDGLSSFTRNHLAKLVSNEVWMLRLLDVEKAIAARGVPAGLTARVELELTDDLFPENAGRFVLEARDGAARLTRAARASSGANSADDAVVRGSVQALAAVYTGHRSAEQAAGPGWLTGSGEALARLSAIFAGPSPWMNERF